jgi:hypothetical protein
MMHINNNLDIHNQTDVQSAQMKLSGSAKKYCKKSWKSNEKAKIKVLIILHVTAWWSTLLY